MARAKPKIQSLPSKDFSKSFSLSDAYKQDIVELLNLEDGPEITVKRAKANRAIAKKAISNIEYVISHYPNIEKMSKGLEISPAQLCAELTPLLKAAQKTSKCMSKLNPGALVNVAHINLPPSYTAWGFSLTPMEEDQREKAWQVIDDFKRSLPLFISNMEKAISILRKRGKRSGKRVPAVDSTVGLLLCIFDVSFLPEPGEPAESCEEPKYNFVRIILKEAKAKKNLPPSIPTTRRGIQDLMKRSQRAVLKVDDSVPPQEA